MQLADGTAVDVFSFGACYTAIETNVTELAIDYISRMFLYFCHTISVWAGFKTKCKIFTSYIPIKRALTFIFKVLMRIFSNGNVISFQSTHLWRPPRMHDAFLPQWQRVKRVCMHHVDIHQCQLSTTFVDGPLQVLPSGHPPGTSLHGPAHWDHTASQRSQVCRCSFLLCHIEVTWNQWDCTDMTCRSCFCDPTSS